MQYVSEVLKILVDRPSATQVLGSRSFAIDNANAL